jgi:uncharacterized protein
MNSAEFEAVFDSLYRKTAALFGGAPGCHDFDHTVRVIRNGELLAAELPVADLRIVRLAALLHDIARAAEISDKGASCHAVAGAGMVPEILGEYGLPGAVVEHIAAAVRTHRFRDNETPETLEAEIVYDADKLDSLGAVGLGRAFLFAGRENARLHNAAAVARRAPAYSREDTAYREYLVKLRKIPAAMLTVPGRRFAAERLAFMADFFDRLNRETGLNLDGPDRTAADGEPMKNKNGQPNGEP